MATAALPRPSLPEDIELGFIVPAEAGELNVFEQAPVEWDGGQLGGLPSWLNTASAMPGPAPACGRCGEPLLFLAQLFAPLDDAPAAYYRMLYLFSCRNGRCTNMPSLPEAPHPAVAVFRGQCARGQEAKPAELQTKLCSICGLLGRSRCSGCSAVHYCGRAHQSLHWSSGHREECGSAAATAASTVASAREAARLAGLLLRSCAVETEAEEDVIGEGEEEGGTGAGAGAEGQAEEDGDPAGDLSISDLSQRELAATTGAGYAALDPTLHAFLDRVGKGGGAAKGQVVRYRRWTNEEAASARPEAMDEAEEEAAADGEGGFYGPQAAPLWFTSAHRPTQADIPACISCGTPRSFEFQLMPQALSFNGNDAWASSRADTDISGMEWGTIAVYTCTASCGGAAATPSAFVPEFVWVQPAASEAEIARGKALSAAQLKYIVTEGDDAPALEEEEES
jgi:pre-rRNA-processing protein TSR4